MKCANKNGLLAAALTLGVWAFSGPALAQAPLQNLKEVNPVTVPSAGAVAPMANEAEIDMAAGAEAESESESDFDVQPLTVAPNIPAAGIVAGNSGVATPAAAGVRTGAAATAAQAANASIPSAVTDVVGDLKRAESNVTLEDVARAQDALARLDLLLDIERKINEIEKVRDERKSIGRSFARDGGRDGAGSFGQIPASALALPVNSPFRPNTPAAPAVAAPSKPVTPVAPRPSADGFKVEQISGGNGRFTAVIADGAGKKNTVSEGEKLGGFTVSKINAAGVTLTNNNDRKVLTVENDGVPLVVRPR